MKTQEEITVTEWLNFYHYARSSANDETKVLDKIMSSTEIVVAIKQAILKAMVVGEVEFYTDYIGEDEYPEKTYYVTNDIKEDIPYLLIPKNSKE